MNEIAQEYFKVANDVSQISDEWAYKQYIDWYNTIRSNTLDFTENCNKPEPEQYTQDEFLQKIKEAKKLGLIK